MSPNSVGLKDKHAFVKTALLIWNPPYYNGDIVEKRYHQILYVIFVEHISTPVLDTKTLYYRTEADKCPQSTRSDNWLT